MKNDRMVTVSVNLTKLMQDFGFKRDFDAFDDVYHDGYSKKYIRTAHLRLPKKLDQAHILFPSTVARVMEMLERESYILAMEKAQIFGFKESLLKIDMLGGGAEYQDMNGNMISAKAGVVKVNIDQAADTVEITMMNPEHLINYIIGGVGLYSPDLPSDSEADLGEISSRIHHLNDYFDVVGESKVSGELSRHFSPDVDDKELEEVLTNDLLNLEEAEVADCVKECIDLKLMTPKDALETAEKYTSVSKDKIKAKILSDLEATNENWKTILK